MKLHFHKSFWEETCNNEHDLVRLTERTHKENYQGTELFLPFYNIDAHTTLKIHKQSNLDIIAGIGTQGRNASEHLISLENQLENALTYEPVLINCHTGRDIFSTKENAALFDFALKFEQQHKISITHETHRFRPTFSTFNTEELIKDKTSLKLNLDVSHWMVVHESDLLDQEERINFLANHSHHIHARVGYEEGPQVTDPSALIWKSHLENHTRIWQKVIDAAKRRGQHTFTITPEFGPFPYAHSHPHTNKHLTDIWNANLFMKNYLETHLLSD